MTPGFLQITPQLVQAPRIELMDLDATCSFELLSRPQKAQRVGWVAPQSLLLPAPALLVEIPIKAPETDVYVPEWAAGAREAFEKIANHRKSSSAHADNEWWSMLYHREPVRAGWPARLNAGKHFDCAPERIEAQDMRLPTSYIVSSTLPTVFYDGVKGFDKDAYLEARAEWRQTEIELGEEQDWETLAKLRNNFFNKLVYPEQGRCWPEGTIVCINSANVHEVQYAGQRTDRGFLHITASEGRASHKTPEYLKRHNPALLKAMGG